MTRSNGRPAWQSIGAGVLIAFAMVGVLVGAILAIWATNHQATASAPSPSAPSAPSAAARSSAPSARSAPSGSSAPSGLVAVVDLSLLRVLPAAVAGAPLTEFPDAEQQAIADPDLGRNVSRVATAFVGDAAGTNWAYTSVVDVRPGSRTEPFYRGWQESFDASACDRAGGVTGHTTVAIAGRDVERTACGAGVRTYHVRLPESGLLISVSDLGDAKYGEQVLANLRP